MKTCLRAVLENGEAGRLLDLSFVDDDHEFGPSPDGTEIHIEGDATAVRGRMQDQFPVPPPGADFRTVTGDDTPSAFYAAAAEGLRRDALWHDPPPCADGCEHDFRLLPVTEFRQTIACAKCGGLAVEASQELSANPAAFIVDDDGRVARKFEIRRRDPAEAAALIRSGYAAAGIPQEIAEAMIEETLEP